MNRVHLRLMKLYMRRFYIMAYGLFHRIQPQVLFDSFAGNQYSDSPRAISEKLHELYPDFKIVWRVSKPEDPYHVIPSYVNIISTNSEFYKALATSFAFVTNEGLEPDIYKRSGQFFVQTWHGDRPFKKVLNEAWNGGTRPIPIVDDKESDICVAASDIGEDVYRKAFKFNGEVTRFGMPRNDRLVFETEIEQTRIKEKLGISKDVSVLLYAPTFRGKTGRKQNIQVNLQNVIEILERKTGSEWVCLMRAHPRMTGLEVQNSSRSFIDASRYPDMADLMEIADFFITDYSSSAGDFVLRNKPMILATFDRIEYQKNCREFKVPVEAPGYIYADTQKQLEEYIEKLSYQDYLDSNKKVISYFNITESGESSARICNMIYRRWKEYNKHH